MFTTPGARVVRVGLLIGCFVFAEPAIAAKISGRLVGDDGQPLSGVQVSAIELRFANCCAQEPIGTRTNQNGEFSLEVPPAVFAVVSEGYSRYNPTAARVNTGAGDVSGLVLQLKRGAPRFLDHHLPRGEQIAIGPADDHGMARLSGSSGTVTAGSYVVLTTLETGHFTVVEAGADGSFAGDHFAPPGSSIMVEADPVGVTALRIVQEGKFGGEGAAGPLDGTIVRAPDAQVTSAGVPVSGTGRMGCCGTNQPVILFRGSISRTTASPGDSIRIQGTLETFSPALRDISALPGNYRIDLVTASDAAGSRGPLNAFSASPLMTPTGLPIEHADNGRNRLSIATNFSFTRSGPERFSAPIDTTISIPAGTTAGWYRPVFTLYINAPNETRGENVLPSIDKQTRLPRSSFYFPTIRIGDPPPARLHWVLLADRFFFGTQGVTSIEDRGQFGLASRIAAQSDTLVVPRIDRASGQPIFYNLAPYLPQISLGDRGIAPSVPFIPFRFPSGRLTMRIHRPDGSTIMAGPSPFVRSRSSTHVNRIGDAVGIGGGHLTDAYQIVTDDPAFQVTFAQDGLYRVELHGEIDDLWGNRWSGGGTYQLYVGNPVVIDTSMLPGTPLETGDALDLGGVIPGQGVCDIEAEVMHDSGGGGEPRRWNLRSRSNRFGRFQPQESVRFGEEGEYRVDMTALCRNEDGLSIGMRTWGGVVASPTSPIIAHGQRGIDSMPSPKPQWFVRRNLTGAQPIPHSHVFFPFHSGDVSWMQKGDAALTAITFREENPGSLTSLMKARFGNNGVFDPRAADGEIPLFSSRPDNIDPIIDPTKIDLWAYSYRSVQRPGVRVREQIVEEPLRSLYWRFFDQYGRQPGTGSRGDLPHDVKFQFGGAVVRGPAAGTPRYAIYGSVFILVPDDDPGGGTRTFPPFQGNGGGPSGGPLFSLKGKPIDLFFHSTGIRPGIILQPFERVLPTGYSAPTLPSLIETTLTSPSGQSRTVSGRANKIGYLFEPDAAFTVTETGRWTAKVKIVFDGRHPGGQVTEPFPSGDILGSRDGEFCFYVVDATSPPLAVEASRLSRPAGPPIVFSVTPPAALTDMELHYTTTMPGFILDEGRTTALEYAYQSSSLARDFPNLDLGDSEGYAGADTITISLLLSGTDAVGTRRHFARQILIEGDEVRIPAQTEVTIKPRRRAVGR